MQVGDLVYVIYLKEYGVIVGKPKYFFSNEYLENAWSVICTSGTLTDENEQDLEVVCK